MLSTVPNTNSESSFRFLASLTVRTARDLVWDLQKYQEQRPLSQSKAIMKIHSRMILSDQAQWAAISLRTKGCTRLAIPALKLLGAEWKSKICCSHQSCKVNPKPKKGGSFRHLFPTTSDFNSNKARPSWLRERASSTNRA